MVTILAQEGGVYRGVRIGEDVDMLGVRWLDVKWVKSLQQDFARSSWGFNHTHLFE